MFSMVNNSILKCILNERQDRSNSVCILTSQEAPSEQSTALSSSWCCSCGGGGGGAALSWQDPPNDSSGETNDASNCSNNRTGNKMF